MRAPGHADASTGLLDFQRDHIRIMSTARSIELSRVALEADIGSGDIAVRGAATAVLVQALLCRRDGTDLSEAQAAVNRLAAVATEPGFALQDICLLRLRSARAG